MYRNSGKTKTVVNEPQLQTQKNQISPSVAPLEELKSETPGYTIIIGTNSMTPEYGIITVGTVISFKNTTETPATVTTDEIAINSLTIPAQSSSTVRFTKQGRYRLSVGNPGVSATINVQ
jgi:plastocyanin